MKMLTMVLVIVAAVLAGCQSADVEVVQPEWPEGTTAEEAVAIAEAMPAVQVFQVVAYGSATATEAVAGGVAKALPLVAGAAGEDEEDVEPGGEP